mmetsp:Transcript_48204/g.133601  ORF Transcript_48204/g.133601 Transcript_48204/m.133601 type:complete len:88 (-) Transcript_48204:2-265(-)
MACAGNPMRASARAVPTASLHEHTPRKGGRIANATKMRQYARHIAWSMGMGMEGWKVLLSMHNGKLWRYGLCAGCLSVTRSVSAKSS